MEGNHEKKQFSAHIWKPSRKLLNPSFNIKILKSFIPIFNEKTKLVVQKVKDLPDNEKVDVSKFIFECTLDMICGKLVFRLPYIISYYVISHR